MQTIGISSRKEAYSNIVVKDILEANRPQAYGPEARMRAKAIGKMLGAILRQKK